MSLIACRVLVVEQRGNQAWLPLTSSETYMPSGRLGDPSTSMTAPCHVYTCSQAQEDAEAGEPMHHSQDALARRQHLRQPKVPCNTATLSMEAPAIS